MASLVFSVLEPLLNDVKDSFVTSLTIYWGIDESRRTLELQLQSILRVLAGAEIKCESHPEIRNWMKQVKAAAYRADTVLDLFRYMALRKKAENGESKVTKMQNKLVQNRLLDRASITRDLKSVTDLFNGLTMEMQCFNLLVDLPAPVDTLKPKTFSTEGPSTKLFGRKDNQETIVKLLLAQENLRGVQVLPVVGMGGIGKTALANEIFNDEQVKSHFKLKLWLFVPDGIDLCGLIRLLLELVANINCHSESVEVLKERLVGAISKRRFLLVMDDVSSANHWEEKLDQILSWAAAPGSCVIVTTRSCQVASAMGTLGTHYLDILGEDEAWEFFSQKAFSKEVEVSQKVLAELLRYGKVIVKQCQGLPLALKVMSALMCKKHLVSEWKSTAESSILQSAGSGNKILSVLRPSYDELSHESKICFAFLASFPNRYAFDKDTLIQMWVSLGYVRAEVGISVEQKGELVFEDLVSNCFLHVVRATDVESERVSTIFDFGYRSDTYHMHDLVHALARSLNDECFSGQELVQLKGGVSSKFACHVSIPESTTPSETVEIGEALDGMDLVRTVRTEQPVFKHIGKGPKQLRLRALRVLQTPFLPNTYRQLEYLIHLRYLDLSGSTMVMLPESVCYLYQLHTLNLSYCCHLESLPEGMVRLTQLHHLYLIDCPRLKRMPRSMGMLINLRTLTTYVIDAEEARGIGELKDLLLLRNELEIRGLNNVDNISSAQDVNLVQKDRITNLTLSWGVCNLGEEESGRNEAILQALQPHSQLHCLCVFGYGGRQVPAWMRDGQNFQCLKKLMIRDCPYCVDLPVVWLSGTLEVLDLSGLQNLTLMCQESMVADGRGSPFLFEGKDSIILFPSLKVMQLSFLAKFTRWAEMCVVTFPKLEVLSIFGCNEISSVPNCPVLKEIFVYECPQLHLRAFEDFSTLLHVSYYSSKRQETAESFPLKSWPLLNDLNMGSLNLTETPLLPESSERMTYLQALQSLRLEGSGWFSVEQPLVMWGYFGNVEVLQVESCPDLCTWPREFGRLKRLKDLTVARCPELVNCPELAVSAGEEEICVIPPNLERLYVDCCVKLIELPELPKSLQELTILNCPKLKEVPSGPRRLPGLPKLRSLVLSSCSDLKELPSVEFGSLQSLIILDSPHVKEFPLGLLVRMHDNKAFGRLLIQGCPVLQAACSNGPYSKLVSSIRSKNVEISKAPRSGWSSCLASPRTAI